LKKETFITLLCAGLMLVTPFTTIAQENKVSNNLSEKQDIDNLVNQIRVVIDEILQKYGHNPVVKIYCNLILNTLGLFGQILLCIFLTALVIPSFAFVLFLQSIGLGQTFIGKVITLYTFVLIMIWGDECVPDLPFSSISTLRDLVKRSNPNCGCPLIK